MDTQNDVREFLTTRRARITPRQAGLPDYNPRRRVPGLRREEVALLAGMSVEYYVRLERGNLKGVSDSVLEGLVRALQLDDAERNHLYDLVRAADEGMIPRTRRTTSTRPITESLQHLLDAMKDVPAFVQNGRLDVLASNALGRALFSQMFEQPQSPPNFGRYVFLDDRAVDFYQDWDATAAQTVALLRTEAGRSPRNRALGDLVGELSLRSHPFRTLWAAHDVREHSTGVKKIVHPVVGRLEIDYEAMQLSGERGLQLIAYSAPPASATADALAVLASWQSTPGLAHPAGGG